MEAEPRRTRLLGPATDPSRPSSPSGSELRETAAHSGRSQKHRGRQPWGGGAAALSQGAASEAGLEDEGCVHLT